MKHKRFYMAGPIKTILSIILVAVFAGCMAHIIAAQITTTTITGVSGFAWSDMPDDSNESYPSAKSGIVGRGAGWISMNNTIGSSSGFGGTVTVNPTSGKLAGYAWSSHIGWIRFDAGIPVGYSVSSQPGTASVGPTGMIVPFIKEIFGIEKAYAQVSSHGGTAGTGTVSGQGSPGSLGGGTTSSGTGSVSGQTGLAVYGTPGPISYYQGSGISPNTGEWSGWARACSVFASGCDGALKPSDVTGGWDGWISLRGFGSAVPGHNGNGAGYGVSSNLATGTTSGYAWGGDITGWIGFDDVVIITNQTVMDTCTDPDGITHQYPHGTAIPLVCSSTLCTDPAATNIGSPLPCILPQAICTTIGALNFGAQGACVFPPGTCTDSAATNYGQPLPCAYTINPPSKTATVSISQNALICGSGTAKLTWNGSGIAPGTCKITVSGASSIGVSPQSGLNGSGTANVTGIPQNGSPNNFTITCDALPGYSPAHPTASTSAMCTIPVTPCDPATDPNHCKNPTGTPKPIYKEN